MARRHLNKASVPQKRNYNKRLAGRLFVIGDSVSLHNVPRKKGKNAKLDCPSERPYVVISVLSEVVYRIQKRRKAQPKVDHSDRIKALSRTATGEMDSKEADAVIEAEARGERHQMCIRQFVDDGQSVPSKRERELNLTKHNLRN